jgi:hypothetical protein
MRIGVTGRARGELDGSVAHERLRGSGLDAGAGLVFGEMAFRTGQLTVFTGEGKARGGVIENRGAPGTLAVARGAIHGRPLRLELFAVWIIVALRTPSAEAEVSARCREAAVGGHVLSDDPVGSMALVAAQRRVRTTELETRKCVVERLAPARRPADE